MRAGDSYLKRPCDGRGVVYGLHSIAPHRTAHDPIFNRIRRGYDQTRITDFAVITLHSNRPAVWAVSHDTFFRRVSPQFTFPAFFFIHLYHLWRIGVQCGCTRSPTLQLLRDGYPILYARSVKSLASGAPPHQPHLLPPAMTSPH